MGKAYIGSWFQCSQYGKTWGTRKACSHPEWSGSRECKLGQGGSDLQRLTTSAVFCQPGPLLSLRSLPKVEDQAFKTWACREKFKIQTSRDANSPSNMIFNFVSKTQTFITYNFVLANLQACTPAWVLSILKSFSELLQSQFCYEETWAQKAEQRPGRQPVGKSSFPIL